MNEAVSAFVWGMPMVVLLLVAGIYLAVRTRFFARFSFMDIFRSVIPTSPKGEKGTISSFQAVSTALAGTIGIGNIVGVSTAIAIGGPGAVFWMWISALIGIPIKYAEIVLASQYRCKNRRGEQVGGPMYYLRDGLKSRSFAAAFCIFCLGACLFGVGNCTQVSSMTVALEETFQIPVYLSAPLVVLAVAWMTRGGIHSTGKIMALLTPLISLFFLVGGVGVCLLHASQILPATAAIFRGAFSLSATGGGVLGFGLSNALRYGFSRGIFSNEAGMGSSPIVHGATSAPPIKQGLCGAFEVFFDTVVIATVTAYAVLTTGVASNPQGDASGFAALAFRQAYGPMGEVFVALSILFFALVSMPCWYYYGEKALEYLYPQSSGKIFRRAYFLIALLCPFVHTAALWTLADTFNGLMALPNLTAVLYLAPMVVRVSRQQPLRWQKRKMKAGERRPFSKRSSRGNALERP